MLTNKVYSWTILMFLIVTLSFLGCEKESPTGTENLTAGTLAKHQPAAGYSYFFGDFAAAPSAIANNGDQIDIGIGAVDVGDFGSFSFHPKTVSGAGSFTITSAVGGPYSGTWTATKLISFKSFGSTDDLFGGTLILQIKLTGASTETHTGILKLTCADFGTPPAGAAQGITLQIAGGQHFTGVWPFPPTTPTAGATFFVTGL